MRYTAGLFFCKTNTIYYAIYCQVQPNVCSFFTAHGPPYYPKRMAINVYSFNVMKYMENRITQWIESAS